MEQSSMELMYDPPTIGLQVQGKSPSIVGWSNYL